MIDPISEEFFKKFTGRAKENTRIYRELFRAEPDNHQKTFEDLKQDREDFKKMGNVELYEKYKEMSPNIQGHMVDYPVEYLKNSDLELNATDMANLVPKINFT